MWTPCFRFLVQRPGKVPGGARVLDVEEISGPGFDSTSWLKLDFMLAAVWRTSSCSGLAGMRAGPVALRAGSSSEAKHVSPPCWLAGRRPGPLAQRAGGGAEAELDSSASWAGGQASWLAGRRPGPLVPRGRGGAESELDSSAFWAGGSSRQQSASSCRALYYQT
jgi:hypothetical protein